MRFIIAATTLAAAASAANVGRDDSTKCLDDILSLATAPPPPPTQFAAVTEASCVPTSLTSALSSYIKENKSWYAKLTSEISKCPAYSETPPPLPDVSVPVCGKDNAGASATATNSDTGAAATTSGGSKADEPKSTNAAAGARETGVVFAAALAVVAAL